MVAQRAGPVLTMFTDGSRFECGAAGYTVMWRILGGYYNSNGVNQEAYDPECAAIARGLESMREETRPRNASGSSRMRRRPLDGWHRTIGRTWPWATIRPAGVEAHCHAAQG